MENILALHADLKSKTYKHGPYHHFKISDPKPRDIHKASVRDRLLHHALYRQLYPFFDKTFIHDSYSCRIGKGAHKAMDRFQSFARKVSRNHTRTCFVLKCDVRKFFASIDHYILLDILRQHIPDKNTLWLLGQVIGSFPQDVILRNGGKGSPCSQTGLPLGNLTSQLLVNIYLNEFDQWVKHTLKARYYIRYADDFVLLSRDQQYLQARLGEVKTFLHTRLKLALHSDKVFIKTYASGVDFLGWVHFPDHRVLRTASKRRMLRRLKETKGSLTEESTKESYRGMLRWGNGRKLQEGLLSS